MTHSLASDRDWLRRLIAAINATTNPPETAAEPGGARSLSHGHLRVPSGSDQFTSERIETFLKLARAL